MSDRRKIFSWTFAVALGLTAMAGLVLVFGAGIARGLGRPSEVAPWALNRSLAEESAPDKLLEQAGLRVASDQWRRNRDLWDRMTDAQRREMLDRYARLRQIDTAERAKLVGRYKELQKMSAADRQKLRRQSAALAAFEATLGRQDLAALDGMSPRQQAEYLVKLWRSSRGLE